VALGGLAPILPGHSIVIPKRAVGQLKDLTEEEVTAL
jgi:diadenosine tetraphosphate (Ap4A) HIT family hydrolase